MKWPYCFLVFIAFVLLGCNNKIGETNNIIVNNGLVNIKIGDPVLKLQELFKDYIITGNYNDIINIYDKDNCILSFGAIEGKIKFIDIFSDQYHTKNGIHVGLRLKDLIKIIGKEKLFLEKDPETGIIEENIAPKSMKTKIDPNTTISVYFLIASNSGKQIGKYEKKDVLGDSWTYNYDFDDAYIKTITIVTEQISLD